MRICANLFLKTPNSFLKQLKKIFVSFVVKKFKFVVKKC